LLEGADTQVVESSVVVGEQFGGFFVDFFLVGRGGHQGAGVQHLFQRQSGRIVERHVFQLLVGFADDVNRDFHFRTPQLGKDIVGEFFVNGRQVLDFLFAFFGILVHG